MMIVSGEFILFTISLYVGSLGRTGCLEKIVLFSRWLFWIPGARCLLIGEVGPIITT